MRRACARQWLITMWLVFTQMTFRCVEEGQWTAGLRAAIRCACQSSKFKMSTRFVVVSVSSPTESGVHNNIICCFTVESLIRIRPTWCRNCWCVTKCGRTICSYIPCTGFRLGDLSVQLLEKCWLHTHWYTLFVFKTHSCILTIAPITTVCVSPSLTIINGVNH